MAPVSPELRLANYRACCEYGIPAFSAVQMALMCEGPVILADETLHRVVEQRRVNLEAVLGESIPGPARVIMANAPDFPMGASPGTGQPVVFVSCEEAIPPYSSSRLSAGIDHEWIHILRSERDAQLTIQRPAGQLVHRLSKELEEYGSVHLHGVPVKVEDLFLPAHPLLAQVNRGREHKLESLAEVLVYAAQSRQMQDPLLRIYGKRQELEADMGAALAGSEKGLRELFDSFPADERLPSTYGMAALRAYPYMETRKHVLEQNDTPHKRRTFFERLGESLEPSAFLGQHGK